MNSEKTIEPRQYRISVGAGLSLHCRDYGPGNEKTPLLCLHGYLRTGRDFEELAARFGTERRVLVPDLRGRGRSDRSADPADYHFDRLAEDVLKILDHNQIERAVIVGLALGAQIGMQLAVDAQHRVAGLVFNDSGPEANKTAGGKMLSFATTDDIDFEEALSRVKAQYAADYPRFGEEEFRRLVYRNYRQAENGAYIRDYDPLTMVDLGRMTQERPTFWEEFKAIRDIPMIILRGANSPYLTQEIADRMLAENPATRLRIIPDCGHPVLLWEPEAFAAIEALLATTDAAPGSGAGIT